MSEAPPIEGRATIAFDAKFSDVVDHRANYLVFLTPEGDSNDLYITQKTSSGFVVREQKGGHATLVFDYRVVAKPLNQDGARLAVSSTLHDAISPVAGHGVPIARHSSPFDRLHARLGSAGFANAIAERASDSCVDGRLSTAVTLKAIGCIVTVSRPLLKTGSFIVCTIASRFRSRSSRYWVARRSPR
jgi:hypothetical protein